MNWQPIETAPKDGTDFLAWGGQYEDFDSHIHALVWVPYNDIRVVSWSHDSNPPCFMGDDCNAHLPTHWMPLPQPPKENE